MVYITKTVREWTAPHLPLRLKALQDGAGYEAPELGHIAIPKVSPHTAAIDQVPPTPGPLKTTMNPSAGLSPPMQKRMLPTMINMQRFMRVTVMARRVRVALQHRTPTPVLVTSLALIRKLMGSPFMRRGPHLSGRSSTSPAPRRKHLPMSPKSRPPVRKSS